MTSVDDVRSRYRHGEDEPAVKLDARPPEH